VYECPRCKSEDIRVYSGWTFTFVFLFLAGVMAFLGIFVIITLPIAAALVVIAFIMPFTGKTASCNKCGKTFRLPKCVG